MPSATLVSSQPQDPKAGGKKHRQTTPPSLPGTPIPICAALVEVAWLRSLCLHPASLHVTVCAPLCRPTNMMLLAVGPTGKDCASSTPTVSELRLKVRGPSEARAPSATHRCPLTLHCIRPSPTWPVAGPCCMQALLATCNPPTTKLSILPRAFLSRALSQV